MKPFDSKKYKRLRDKWYGKLKKEGFEDIEDVDSEREMLKSWHSQRFQIGFEAVEFVSRQKYYELAAQLLHDARFENDFERQIWQLHSEGRSERQIAKAIKTKVWRVKKVIHSCKMLMLKK